MRPADRRTTAAADTNSTWAWWKSLRPTEQDRVTSWIANNPPPPEWRGSNIDWAFTEMPFAPDNRK
jgi:hypothetical protein